MKRIKLIKQIDNKDCGKATIAMILNYYKSKVSIYNIGRNYNIDYLGLNLNQMIEIMKSYSFDVRAINVPDTSVCSKYTLPSIALMNHDLGHKHYVVIYKIKNNFLFIADPAKGKYKLKKEDFLNCFTGVMLIMAPNLNYKNICEKSGSMFQFFKFLVLPQKKMIFTVLIASAFTTIMGILGGTFSKILMDEIIPYETISLLTYTVIFFCILIILQVLLNAFRQQVVLYLSRKIDLPVVLGYFDHILNLPMSFFGQKRIGDILTRYQDSETIKSIVTSLSVSLILDICLAFGSTIVLCLISWQLFVVLFLQLIISIIMIYTFKKPYKNLNYDLMRMNSNVNSYLIESFQNIETIKSYNNEDKQIENLEKKTVELLQRSFEGGVMQNAQSSFSGFINGIFPILLFGIGAYMIIQRQLSIGDLLFFQTLGVFFLQPVQDLASLQITFQEANIAIERLNEMMSVSREDEHSETNIKNINLIGDIQLSNITFSYDGRKNILSNINLTIKNKSKVAIIGKSGSGKSTIAKLLLKFLNPQNGVISIDGYNVQDIDVKTLRNNITYVSQKIDLFTGTIADNIRFNNDEIGIEEVLNVCKLVGLDDLINTLPNRLDTHIEENGINFSLGEKQRICIARALLKGGNIFIFDESTSNLDEANEKIFKNLILNTLSEKTVIIISHKATTIEGCSDIYMLENGSFINKQVHKVDDIYDYREEIEYE